MLRSLRLNFLCFVTVVGFTIGVPSVSADIPTPRMVFFGDSLSWLTPGYADMTCAALMCNRVNPHDALPGSTLECASFLTVPCGGDTYDTRVSAFSYDTLVVEYGINDLYAMVAHPDTFTLSTWDSAISGILTRSVHHRTIVLSLPYVTGVGGFPVPAWAADYGDMQRKIDAITQEDSGRSGATFVPLRMTAGMIGADGVHPNAYGMQWMAKAVLSAVGGSQLPVARTVTQPSPPITPTPNSNTFTQVGVPPVSVIPHGR